MIKLRVKEILKEKRITQKEFASQLGMSEVGLSKSINDSGNPDLKRLSEIAAALNVSITSLFEEKCNPANIVCPNCGRELSVKVE